MKRKTWILSGLATMAVVVALAWAFAPQPVAVEIAVATQGRFQTTIDEDGRTRLRDRFVVSAPLSGRLARIVLREGDPVTADDVVATITPAFSPLLDERTARELGARVEAAQANVRLAAARSARSRVALAQARNELQRSEQLAQQGFVSSIKLDTDRLSVQAAQKELDAAQQAEQVASYELAQARAAQSVARSVVPGSSAPSAAARSAGRPPSAQGFAVRAPVTGQVLRLHQTSESVVALGAPLMEVGDTRRLEVVAELLSTDALQAQPGASVLIERWGGPGSLQGRVRRVEPAAVTKVSALGVEEQRVNVLIDITSPPAQWTALGDGFRVSVRIVTLTQDDAVRVPVSAVFPLPSGTSSATSVPSEPLMATEAPRMAVFVIRDGRAQQVPVELGGRNASTAWVRSGLPVGTEVIVYPPAAVKDGVKVKVRKV